MYKNVLPQWHFVSINNYINKRKCFVNISLEEFEKCLKRLKYKNLNRLIVEPLWGRTKYLAVTHKTLIRIFFTTFW